jgi:hypothetical protein
MLSNSRMVAQQDVGVWVGRLTSETFSLSETSRAAASSEVRCRRSLADCWVMSRKLVIIGDGACGKTSLLSVFTLGYFPTVSAVAIPLISWLTVHSIM